jgi:hypothetical protein
VAVELLPHGRVHAKGVGYDVLAHMYGESSLQ